MDKRIKTLYAQFRKDGRGLVGREAEMCLRAARTLAAFQDQDEKTVRIRCEYEEESYFDVFGRECISKDKRIEEVIERLGCVYVYTEYLNNGEWQHADYIGMCIYENPLSPFENCYVIDLMQSALECAAKAQHELEMAV